MLAGWSESDMPAGSQPAISDQPSNITLATCENLASSKAEVEASAGYEIPGQPSSGSAALPQPAVTFATSIRSMQPSIEASTGSVRTMALATSSAPSSSMPCSAVGIDFAEASPTAPSTAPRPHVSLRSSPTSPPESSSQVVRASAQPAKPPTISSVEGLVTTQSPRTTSGQQLSAVSARSVQVTRRISPHPSSGSGTPRSPARPPTPPVAMSQVLGSSGSVNLLHRDAMQSHRGVIRRVPSETTVGLQSPPAGSRPGLPLAPVPAQQHAGQKGKPPVVQHGASMQLPPRMESLSTGATSVQSSTQVQTRLDSISSLASVQTPGST